MLFRLRLACLLMASAAAASSFADSRCQDDWICLDEVRRGGDLELQARNLRNFPITYTLEVEPRNYRIAGPETVTRSLGPGETQSAMLLDQHDGRARGTYKYKLKWTVGQMNVSHDDDHLYALPYGKERTYPVLQGYGSRFSHTGSEEFSIDFNMREGTPVHAARSGVVARVEESNTRGCWDDGCGKFANFIVILHADGSTGEYYHLQKNGALVEAGDKVVQGQKIGLSGNTGHSTMPHLHFGVYRAISWGRTQSIPVRFQSADGIINRPRRGGRYQAQ